MNDLESNLPTQNELEEIISIQYLHHITEAGIVFGGFLVKKESFPGSQITAGMRSESKKHHIMRDHLEEKHIRNHPDWNQLASKEKVAELSKPMFWSTVRLGEIQEIH